MARIAAFGYDWVRRAASGQRGWHITPPGLVPTVPGSGGGIQPTCASGDLRWILCCVRSLGQTSRLRRESAPVGKHDEYAEDRYADGPKRRDACARVVQTD